MLRNRSFRTKILAVTMAPLLVLCLFAALLVKPRVAEARAATANQRGAVFAQLTAEMVAGLQEERDLSAWWVVSKSKVLQRDVKEARVESDRLRKELLAYGSNVPANLLWANAEATRAVRDLEGLRKTVDNGGLTPSRVSGSYSLRINSLLKFTRALAAESSSVKLNRQASALAELVEAREQASSLRGQIVAKLQGRGVLASDLLGFAQIQNDMTSRTDRYRNLVDAGEGERLAKVMLAPRMAVSNESFAQIQREVLADEPTTVTAQKWWDDQEPILSELRRFTTDRFKTYGVETGRAADSASRQVLFFALTAMGAVLAAALIALSLARTITRRLSSLAEQARIIATDKLPEVLNALRNPTAEAVSGALPTVRSDSDDELGIMAESFNKVLHMSVKTSLEHSQQRAQTVTNMLVNLGRRNQSLIDRQLKIMDRLEAKEEDPETLEALYEVDHLVTRMRRNAENLLVLSGQKQARTWAKPVTLFDVLRSAASEVSDLNRAVIGDVSTELIMSGPFAVDVSHLLAELVENATRYSPKTTAVSIAVQETENYIEVAIGDSGVGMSEDEFASSNERLAHPPEIDELATDRVGFQVVGRLARKLNAPVQVGPNTNGGVIATVFLPRALFEAQQQGAGGRPGSLNASLSGAGSSTGQAAPTSRPSLKSVPDEGRSYAANTANTAFAAKPKQSSQDPQESRSVESPSVGGQKVGLRSQEPTPARAPVTQRPTPSPAAESNLPQRDNRPAAPLIAPEPAHSVPVADTRTVQDTPFAPTVPTVPTVPTAIARIPARTPAAVVETPGAPVSRPTPAEAVLMDVERLIGRSPGGPSAANGMSPTGVPTRTTSIPNPPAVPERSVLPERSALPERSVLPNPPAVPERSGLPERSALPERSGLPDRSAVPERSPLPERTAAQPKDPSVSPFNFESRSVTTAVASPPPVPLAPALDELPRRGQRAATEQPQREGFGRLPSAPVAESRSASTFAAFQTAKQRLAEAPSPSQNTTTGPSQNTTTGQSQNTTTLPDPGSVSVPDPRPAEPEVSTPAASVDPEIGDTPHRNDHVVADTSDRAPASSGSVAVAELTHTHIEATPETDLVTNDNGLIQRRPGKVFSTAAQAADAGAFKRLGDGAEDSSIDNVPPSSRFAALSRLQRGVTNARVPHTNPSDPSNTTDTEI